jgi:Holliday junction resolvase
MSRSERDKGAAGEREVAAIFRAHGFDCDRVPNSGGLRLKGDLYGVLPVHVEVKRQERLQLWQWWEQAVSEAPEDVSPVLAFRRNRSEWLAVVRLDDLIGLLEIE